MFINKIYIFDVKKILQVNITSFFFFLKKKTIEKNMLDLKYNIIFTIN